MTDHINTIDVLIIICAIIFLVGWIAWVIRLIIIGSKLKKRNAFLYKRYEELQVERRKSDMYESLLDSYHLNSDDTAGLQDQRRIFRNLENQVRQTRMYKNPKVGINELADVARMLDAGADKVSVNSAALRNPKLVGDIASHFGSQVCVVAIDARCTDGNWECYLNGGRVPTGRGLFDWACEVADRGAGEILFTSMNHDGVKQGFANDALARLSDELDIPVIASGGAGAMQHFADAFTIGRADAALAASVFHFGEIAIPDLKQFLRAQGICVRI